MVLESVYAFENLETSKKRFFVFSSYMKKFLFSKNWNFPKSILTPPLLPWEKKMRIVKKNYQLTSWDGTLKFPRRLTSWDGTKKRYIFSRDVWRAEMALWNSQVFVFALKMSCRFFWKKHYFWFSFSRAKPKVRKRDAFEKIVFSNVKIRKSHHKSRKSNFEEVTFFAKSHLERGGVRRKWQRFFLRDSFEFV